MFLQGWLPLGDYMRANLFCDKQFRRMDRWTALVDFLHWALLGAQTGTLTALLITARVWAAARLQDRSAQAKGLALAGFSMLFTIAMTATWSGPVSILLWLAVLNASYAYFFATGVGIVTVWNAWRQREWPQWLNTRG